MNKQTYNITLAILLLGIEKLLIRSEKKSVQELNSVYNYLKKYINNPDILVLLKENNDLIEKKIIDISNRITQGNLEEQNENQLNYYKPLRSIFSRLNNEENRTPSYYGKNYNDFQIPYPQSQQDSYLDKEYYEDLLLDLTDFFENFNEKEENLNSVLNKLEEVGSFIPSTTEIEEYDDISLFDNLKITAAIGACLSEYFLNNPQKKSVLDNLNFLYKEDLFILFSADFSGIQDFIYTITTKNALKSLRSRSFFLEFLMEHFIDELLDVCGLSRANLLYSGGGHCYLLLPNTHDVEEKIKTWVKKFNNWLLKNYDIKLYLACGWTKCSINELMNLKLQDNLDDSDSYKQMFEQVSDNIANKKMQRYSAEDIRELNNSQETLEGRECVICGRSDGSLKETENGERIICPSCKLFEDISNKVFSNPVYYITENSENFDFELPGFNNNKFISILPADNYKISKRIENDDKLKRIYTRNYFEPDLPKNSKLNIGFYIAKNNKTDEIIKDLEEFSKTATGINRIGVLRMDVDNLGAAFIAGFENSKDKDKYVSIVRTSAFSRALSNFFKYYINQILDGSADDSKPLNVAIVYSGGDDVFLLGAWDDIVEAAQRIRNALFNYTDGALTISAGIGLYNAKFPIRSAAYKTADMEEASKNYKDENGIVTKNSITFFEPYDKYSFSWDQLFFNIKEEKLSKLKEFFKNIEDKGMTVLYNIYLLLDNPNELNDSDNSKLNLARLAYTLSRLQPSKNDKEKSDLYGDFIKSILMWAKEDKKSKKELIMAIMLYMYSVREEKNEQ